MAPWRSKLWLFCRRDGWRINASTRCKILSCVPGLDESGSGEIPGKIPRLGDVAIEPGAGAIPGDENQADDNAGENPSVFSDVFFAYVSHELKSPRTSNQGFGSGSP
jgi:hypothetical protein